VALGSATVWRPTYPLVLPQTIYVIGGGVAAGAGTGLHALGAARRSLRVAVIAALLAAGSSILGAVLYGAVGTIYGLAVGVWVGALINWLEFRKAWQETKRARAVTHEHSGAGADSAHGGR
jgi:hypothetical protein